MIEKLEVVSVTTDPKTDTPAVLGEYLTRFVADLPPRFTGVHLAEEDGRLHSSLLPLYGSDDEPHVAFDAGHTARDVAADPGRSHTVFEWTVPRYRVAPARAGAAGAGRAVFGERALHRPRAGRPGGGGARRRSRDRRHRSRPPLPGRGRGGAVSPPA